jgi:hypothetical protein
VNEQHVLKESSKLVELSPWRFYDLWIKYCIKVLIISSIENSTKSRIIQEIHCKIALAFIPRQGYECRAQCSAV